MRDLAILTFITLDGVMQAPAHPDEDRSGGFTQGGWAQPYWDAVMQQVGREAMNVPYDMIFGHKTFATFRDHLRGQTEEPAVRFHAAQKHVVASPGASLDWENSKRIEEPVAEGVQALKAEDGPLLQIHGSWQLIQTLIAHDLIDEFRLWIFPCLVGPGKRLFPEDGPNRSLRLLKSEPTGNGAVMSIYRRD